MPDVDEVLEELTGFAAHPPAAPTEVDALRGRARRARTKRRILTGTAATICILLVAGIGVAVFADGDDDGQDLEVGNPTTLPSVNNPETGPAGVGNQDATATPNENLEDGSEILV